MGNRMRPHQGGSDHASCLALRRGWKTDGKGSRPQMEELTCAF
jgi:hypothetical protein